MKYGTLNSQLDQLTSERSSRGVLNKTMDPQRYDKTRIQLVSNMPVIESRDAHINESDSEIDVDQILKNPP